VGWMASMRSSGLTGFVVILGLCVLGLFSRTTTAQTLQPGRELLGNGDFKRGTECWELSLVGEARAQWKVMDSGGPTESTPALQVVIEKTGTANWHVRVIHGGLSVVADRLYQFSVWSRSAQSTAQLAWSLQQAREPYRILTPQAFAVPVSDKWQQYTRSVQVIAGDSNVNLNLIVGFAPTTLWIAAVRLQELATEPSASQQTSEQVPCRSILLSESVYRVARDMAVPLPSPVRLTVPGPDIAPERAAFFGAWAGRWGGSLPHIFVIQEITFNPTRVAAIYATGATGRSSGYWSYVRGVFSGSDLILDRFSNGAQATYRMNPDGTLSGTYEYPGFPTSTIRMQKIRD